MASGEWRMENGEWRMENGEWRIKKVRFANQSGPFPFIAE
jgi:hypothetical protein